MREILDTRRSSPTAFGARKGSPPTSRFNLPSSMRGSQDQAPLHRNWLQVQVGEVLTCNGCHARIHRRRPRERRDRNGRSNLFRIDQSGRSRKRLFPKYGSTAARQSGETMAANSRSWICKLGNGMSACIQTADVHILIRYDARWTDPARGAAVRRILEADYCFPAHDRCRKCCDHELCEAVYLA